MVFDGGKHKMNNAAAFQTEMNAVAKLYNQGNFSGALKKIKPLIKRNPLNPGLLSSAGGICLKAGKLPDAQKYCQKAISLAPDYPDAHNNLAAVLNKQGKYKEAIASCHRAIKLNPEHFDAHNNMGNAWKALGELDKAVSAYQETLKIQPHYAEVYYNIGNIFRERNEITTAIEHYQKALRLNPNLGEALENLAGMYRDNGEDQNALACYQQLITQGNRSAFVLQSLADILSRKQFTQFSPDLENLFLILLEQQGFVRPDTISSAAYSLLSHKPSLACLLNNPLDYNIDTLTQAITGTPLLLALMKKALVVDQAFENALTSYRKRLLQNRNSIVLTETTAQTIEALALCCFNNEYIFEETEEETRILSNLHTTPIDTLSLLLLALYRSIEHIAQDTSGLRKLCPILYKRAVLDRQKEEKYKKDIPSLSEVDDIISALVQEQYEENPYPRWEDIALRPVPETYSEIAKRNKLISVDTVDKPTVLIAGCGTGQHSITTATRIKNASIKAVDLSKSSLAYAIRKTNELKIPNIEYWHGDLLEVRHFGQEFDHVESVGVLHHMADPLKGWKALVDALKPGGIMFIGLYSKLARSGIKKIRQDIHERGLNPTLKDIRQLRCEILQHPENDTQGLHQSKDFFSTSNCRDLLFHVQEHCFTIPELQKALTTFNLDFLGFELEAPTRLQFVSAYGEEALYDLTKWAEFEKENPQTFAGMYQFWLQKK